MHWKHYKQFWGNCLVFDFLLAVEVSVVAENLCESGQLKLSSAWDKRLWDILLSVLLTETQKTDRMVITFNDRWFRCSSSCRSCILCIYIFFILEANALPWTEFKKKKKVGKLLQTSSSEWFQTIVFLSVCRTCRCFALNLLGRKALLIAYWAVSCT